MVQGCWVRPPATSSEAAIFKNSNNNNNNIFSSFNHIYIYIYTCNFANSAPGDSGRPGRALGGLRSRAVHGSSSRGSGRNVVFGGCWSSVDKIYKIPAIDVVLMSFCSY